MRHPEVSKRAVVGGLVAFGVVLVPNVAMAVLAGVLGVYRPLVNFDYVVTALFFILMPRWLASIFFCCFLLMDVIAVVGQIFPFLRPQDVLYLSQFLVIAPVYYKVMAFSIAALAVFSLFFFLRLRWWASKGSVLVVVNVFLVFYLISIFGLGKVQSDLTWRFEEERYISSQSVFVVDVSLGGFVKAFQLGGEPFEPAPYEGISAPLFSESHKKSNRLLLVVVESWGVSSPEAMEAVLSPVLRKRNQFKHLSWGELPFEGATIAGELRELCQYWPKHFNLRAATEGFEACLPNDLKEQGYQTIAMHGAAGTMYDRAYWYPLAGFEARIFFESKPWKNRCYSFPGACDYELMGEVQKFFSGVDKGFFYWLTLNSHFSYDSRDIKVDVFDCKKYGVEENEQVCRNLKLHAQFFHYFSKLLESSDMENVEVMVVGDHDPIITNWKESEKYFKKNRVPWLKIET